MGSKEVARPSGWRSWLLLPLWVYGLFVFVNLSQYAWMWAAAFSHGVPFGRVAGGSLQTPALDLIRGLLGPLVGVPFLALALRLLAPRRLDRSVLRFRPRKLALGGVMGSLALATVIGMLALAGVLRVVGWPARMPTGSLVALVGGKLLWSVFKSGLEDVLFVGVLASSWAAARGWRAAALPTGIFFGAIHLVNIVPVLTLAGALTVMVAGAVFGALLTLLVARHGSLWAAVGFHAAWNVGLGTVLGTTLSGGRGMGGLWVTELHGSPWLTGGVFGVEASWLSILVTAAMLAPYALRRQRTDRCGRSPDGSAA